MLALLLITAISTTANSTDVTVKWQANSEADLAGYKLYWGTATRDYQVVMDVGMDTVRVLHDFQDSTMYYFTVTAYDTAGNESVYGNEDSVYVVHDKAPSPPVGCTAKQTR